MSYGKQVGVIVYGGGINIRAFVNETKRAGFVVVFRDGYATVHERS